jgi:hypothetical protein
MRIRVEGKLDDKYVDELTTFPTELEGLASLKALYALSPSAISNLLKLGYDELDKRRGGLVPGLPVAKTTGPSFTMDELVPRGYVVEVEPVVSGDTSHWIALSDDGRRLARILTANEAAPTWLWDASQKYHECSERP